MPILYQFLKILNLDAPDRFAEQIHEIINKHSIRIKLLDVAIKMEHASQQDSKHKRITVFPKHDPNTELAWYDQHVTSKTEPTLSLGTLHEGRLIRRKGKYNNILFWCNNYVRCASIYVK